MNIHSELPQDTPPEPHRPGLFARLRGNFLTGIIFIAPFAITGWFIWWAINFIDAKVAPFIPDRFVPQINGYDIPGIGVIFFLIVTTIAGALAKGYVGRQFAKFIGATILRFPIIRPIYNALKQIIETIFERSDQSFQYACIVEYPRKGIYAMGFVSVEAQGELREKLGKDLLAVFVPTTPNPTSGFLLYFPREDIIMLDMSVEDAAKQIISAGLVEGNSRLDLPQQEKPRKRA